MDATPQTTPRAPLEVLGAMRAENERAVETATSVDVHYWRRLEMEFKQSVSERMADLDQRLQDIGTFLKSLG